MLRIRFQNLIVFLHQDLLLLENLWTIKTFAIKQRLEFVFLQVQDQKCVDESYAQESGIENINHAWRGWGIGYIWEFIRTGWWWVACKPVSERGEWGEISGKEISYLVIGALLRVHERSILIGRLWQSCEHLSMWKQEYIALRAIKYFGPLF